MTKLAEDWITMLFGIVGLVSFVRPRRKHEPPRHPYVLAFVPEGPNRDAVRAISAQIGLDLIFAGSPETRAATMPQIVIYDRELTVSDWAASIHALAQHAPRPYIILLSPTLDANLWDELQRAGGVDIVRSPVDPQLLLGALQRASRLWSCIQQVRRSSGDDALANGVQN